MKPDRSLVNETGHLDLLATASRGGWARGRVVQMPPARAYDHRSIPGPFTRQSSHFPFSPSVHSHPTRYPRRGGKNVVTTIGNRPRQRR
jgi:hypothetical protein